MEASAFDLLNLCLACASLALALLNFARDRGAC